jgi:hypothetical protein
MGHSHGSSAALTGRRLGLSIVITIVFVLAEAVTGYFSHSLALLSDAGHNFAFNRTANLWLSQGGDIRRFGECRVFGRHCFINLLGGF